jgi:hypothetical protein
LSSRGFGLNRGSLNKRVGKNEHPLLYYKYLYKWCGEMREENLRYANYPTCAFFHGVCTDLALRGDVICLGG